MNASHNEGKTLKVHHFECYRSIEGKERQRDKIKKKKKSINMINSVMRNRKKKRWKMKIKYWIVGYSGLYLDDNPINLGLNIFLILINV